MDPGSDGLDAVRRALLREWRIVAASVLVVGLLASLVPKALGAAGSYEVSQSVFVVDVSAPLEAAQVPANLTARSSSLAEDASRLTGPDEIEIGKRAAGGSIKARTQVDDQRRQLTLYVQADSASRASAGLVALLGQMKSWRKDELASLALSYTSPLNERRKLISDQIATLTNEQAAIANPDGTLAADARTFARELRKEVLDIDTKVSAVSAYVAKADATTRLGPSHEPMALGAGTATRGFLGAVLGAVVGAALALSRGLRRWPVRSVRDVETMPGAEVVGVLAIDARDDERERVGHALRRLAEQAGRPTVALSSIDETGEQEPAVQSLVSDSAARLTFLAPFLTSSQALKAATSGAPLVLVASFDKTDRARLARAMGELQAAGVASVPVLLAGVPRRRLDMIIDL